MSRIHEALQRANQERKSRTALDTDQQSAAPESALSQLNETASRSVTPNHDDPAAVLPSPDPTYNQQAAGINMLTSRCKQIDWAPRDNDLMSSRDKKHRHKAEVFRTLRSRLYRLRSQIPLHSLLITSALPAEGKSFIAHNLSHAIAQQHGRRALLIDADLRMPTQHTLLGAPQSPGLTGYLRGDIDESEILQRGQQEDLYFIPSGQAVKNPVELISNGRMKALLEHMTHIFDWVILDSPPMAPVSDASLLADMCDGALLVVRTSMTPYDLAQKARDDFKKTPLVGVVLNGVDGTANYGSYYYSHYSAEPAED